MSKKTSYLILISLIISALTSCEEKYEEPLNIVQRETVSIDSNTFVDSRDGNIYGFVQIGEQIWMSENLKYLPAVFGADSGSKTKPLYYVYGYHGTSVSEAKATTNYNTYGVLYNWPAAVVDTSFDSESSVGPEGICPKGWHLPSNTEWKQVVDYLGGRPFAGGKLKATGFDFWKKPNVAASNETGFTALAAGNRVSNGTFNDLNINGFWWTSTSNGKLNAWFRNLYYDNGAVYRIDFFKDAGMCVRCVKNSGADSRGGQESGE